jgi:protein dithiol:quinone oxidoreductase
MKISPRLIYSLASLFAIGVLAFSLYLQFYQGLQPCALCVAQRYLVAVLGLLSFVGVFYRSALWVGGLMTLTALMGIVTAARKIWLERLPADQVPACGPGLEYMLDYLPFHKTLEVLFMGSGECSEKSWQFLGIELSEWTLLCFVVFLGVSIWQMGILDKNRHFK